jgi:hypothetical protein
VGFYPPMLGIASKKMVDFEEMWKIKNDDF